MLVAYLFVYGKPIKFPRMGRTRIGSKVGEPDYFFIIYKFDPEVSAFFLPFLNSFI